MDQPSITTALIASEMTENMSGESFIILLLKLKM